jgi:hypothetical protein
MSRRYYTLAQWDREAERWTIEFGDYSRSVVQSEHRDYRDKGASSRHLRIVVSEDDQASISKAVSSLPRVYAARHQVRVVKV